MEVIITENWEAAYIAGIIDGEGSITLTRMHAHENRRPCITISSTDIELLEYIKNLAGGSINNKKNYKPEIHKNSFTLNIKQKDQVFHLLMDIYQFLRVQQKKKRAEFILNHFNLVTKRNGKYTQKELEKKKKFEEDFFNL
ncbi:LAGLIDADG family homing endonuclease [Sutcliffiella halmapala]